MENQDVIRAYEACAAIARTVGEESAIDQLRQAINADPHLALLMDVAGRRSAICGLAAADEAIPEE